MNDLHAHQLNVLCNETELHDHLCRQRDARAPLSRWKALMEAIVFVRHVFGCESLGYTIKVGGAWERPARRRWQL